MHRNARKREVCCGCVERGEAGMSIAGKQERGGRREVRDACGPFGREDMEERRRWVHVMASPPTGKSSTN